MTDGYVQQPGSSTDVRVDGKRVAGKMSFNPPGSGGSRPEMAERDMDFIPEVEGGREAQPAGHHLHAHFVLLRGGRIGEESAEESGLRVCSRAHTSIRVRLRVGSWQAI